MDSRLLNVFHDDPFDGNYQKYENDTDFWSSGSETMGLQLTETLHGILPIAPTEDVVDIYGNTILKDDFHLEHKDDTSTTLQSKNAAMIYHDFAQQHINGGSIEIVTVDPTADDFDSDDSDDDGDIVFDDNRSQCSNSTFRTRTDSSSIGDYESHSSDYDDDEEDDEVMELKGPLNVISQNSFMPITELSNNGILESDDLILDTSFKLPLETMAGSKNRTISTNTIGSDVDGLGLQIDASTFDLADFITKDDFALLTTPIPTAAPKTIAMPVAKTHQSQSLVSPVVQVISSKHSDTDSDSDVIVDVETVEIDAEEEQAFWAGTKAAAVVGAHEDDLPFVDNVKSDPSWNPNQVKKSETVAKDVKAEPTATTPPITEKPSTSTSQQNFGRNFSVIPSKRQCDILKGKFGCGRGKNLSIQSKGKTVTKKLQEATATKNSLHADKMVKAPLASKAAPKLGMGLGGKNLSLIKQERYSISEQSSEENSTPVKISAAVQSVPQQQTQPQQQNLEITEPPTLKSQAVKRKLNLEEYKKRRGENGTTSNGNIHLETFNKIPKLEIDCNGKSNAAHTTPPPHVVVTPTKHSEAVTKVVKTLKQEMLLKPATDPITEAKNKVLRMQELKRAQQLRIIDSAVSAKVPRVTKLPPLKEIIKDSNDQKQKKLAAAVKTHPDYEEIIIISASCNTEISIPPVSMLLQNYQYETANIKPVNNAASRSLLKSSALLYNISSSFNKVQATDSVRISSNSLIASIQDVVVKKTMPAAEQANVAANLEKVETIKKKPGEHGENKIIMHLRKDRVRKRTVSMAMQTDFLAEFPPLPLPKISLTRKPRDRTRQKTRRSYRKRKNTAGSGEASSSPSSGSDESDASSCSRNRSPAAASYRSRSRSAAADSCSSSTERTRHSGAGDPAAGTGGYSSRSSRRHRSSISSSYSESDRMSRNQRRQRKSGYKQRTRKHSRSSSSSSLSDYSDRRSRTRSRSPLYRRERSRSRSRQRNYNNNNNFVDRNVSQPAVEERRIVYVGRIEQETTKEMLRRKFLTYGNIKQITIHYKDTGMKYGFVTYERPQDAFTVIDTSARDPNINMYDISFGGRRAFCRASYADLDNAGINTYQSYVFPKAAAAPKEDDSFEALLLKVKAKMNANKSSSSNTSTAASKI